MRFALALWICLAISPVFAGPVCQDILLSRDYFSIFFQAAGGEFLRPSELARQRARATESLEEELAALSLLQNGGSGKNRGDGQEDRFRTPLNFAPEMAEQFEEILTLEIRAFLQNDAFKDFSRSPSRELWTRFESQYLEDPEGHDHLEFRDILWAAVSLSALSGDLSLGFNRLSEMVYSAHKDPGLGVDDKEQMLVLYALNHRIDAYSIAAEFFDVDGSLNQSNTVNFGQAFDRPRTEDLGLSSRQSLGSPYPLNWSYLESTLSPEELFLMQQVLSWETPSTTVAASPGHLVPRNFQGAVNLLLSDLAQGEVRATTLVLFERAMEWPATEEEQLVLGLSAGERPTRTLWRQAFQWIQGSQERASRLVNDTMELQRFFPEIR